MKNQTQLYRYKKLLQFLEEKFKEDISIPDIEAACHYSYRNINRIFEALQHETIGKYVKRQKLERAAQYLKYSEQSISDIAFEVGFGDIAAFSKAFKKRFGCAPSAFRNSAQVIRDINQKLTAPDSDSSSESLKFEIEKLPEFEILGLEYRGSYEDISSIHRVWQQLVEYASIKNLINDDTIFLAEILDDDEISDLIHCRYNVGIILEHPLDFEPEGLFFIKKIESRKYAKFLHKGRHEESPDTYNKIYSRWIFDINHEPEDAPVLEFFLNDEQDTPPDELLTEIYVPIK